MLFDLLLCLCPQRFWLFFIFLEIDVWLWSDLFLWRLLRLLRLHVVDPIKFIKILGGQLIWSYFWKRVIVQNIQDIISSLVVLIFHFSGSLPVLFCLLLDFCESLFFFFLVLVKLFIFTLNILLEVIEPLFVSV